MTVLHLAPHPDDELIGAPAVLMALRDAGRRVVNAACSLGGPDDRERRREELGEACRRARFELVLPDVPIAMSESVGDDLDQAQADLAAWLRGLLGEHRPDLVISPSPHDRHSGHEVVGRAVRDVLAGQPGARWWMWGLWADLPLPTVLVGFAEDRLQEILWALEAHAGEIARNDYRALVRGRAQANAVLGTERVFGWGREQEATPYAEVLTDVARLDERWRLGAPQRLAGEIVPFEPAGDVTWWVEARSITQRLAQEGLRS